MDRKKVSAIIAEYNPFHNGHKYHIEQTRANGASHIIAIMSGAVVQRGDVAIFDKHFRAKQAVIGGADLVIELPCPFSCSCAEIFAKGAVNIIARLGIADELSFGCETEDIELLERCADISTELSDCADILSLTSQGMSYPAAFAQIVSEHYGDRYAEVFRTPNNTLAIEYIKALRQYRCGIQPLAVKRKGAEHDSSEPSCGIASASYIRSLIHDAQDISGFVPYETENEQVCDINSMSRAIFIRLSQLVQSGEYENIPDFTHELAQRFRKVMLQLKTADYSKLLETVKVKSFTRAKVSRAFINAYLGVTANDLTLQPYARVLAFNCRGQELLKEIKHNSSKIEVSTSLADFTEKRLCDLDELSCRLQRFCCDNIITSEYTRKFDGFINC